MITPYLQSDLTVTNEFRQIDYPLELPLELPPQLCSAETCW